MGTSGLGMAGQKGGLKNEAAKRMANDSYSAASDEGLAFQIIRRLMSIRRHSLIGRKGVRFSSGG